MAHVRGHRAVYDAWAADGAPGWGFADLLPYFRRSERAEGRDPLGGRSGDAPWDTLGRTAQNGAARMLFALGRDGLLPHALGRTTCRSPKPPYPSDLAIWISVGWLAAKVLVMAGACDLQAR